MKLDAPLPLRPSKFQDKAVAAKVETWPVRRLGGRHTQQRTHSLFDPTDVYERKLVLEIVAPEISGRSGEPDRLRSAVAQISDGHLTVDRPQ